MAYVAVAAALSLVLVAVGVGLARPGVPDESDALAAGVPAQLTFVGNALRDGAGERMQALFPEGFFFSHALHGLAWVDVGLRLPAGERAEALAAARTALAALSSSQGRAPFTRTLDPPYGVFHAGWTAWLRGGVLSLQDPADRDPAEVARFAEDCAALAAAFDASPSPFLTAYPGQAWPVDSVVAVAALRLHDTLLAPRHDATISRWLESASARLDPASGLLPHRADPSTGEPLQGAQGSSQSIIARFLPEIDPEVGRRHYLRFRALFVTSVLGLAGVREYPLGSSGAGEVDSGPLVAGISASASVVTLGAAQVHGDRELAAPLSAAAELAGLPITWRGAKRYALGALPVGDAFLVWARTARPRVAAVPPCRCPAVVPTWWRLPWMALLAAVLGLIWLPVALRLRRVHAQSRP